VQAYSLLSCTALEAGLEGTGIMEALFAGIVAAAFLVGNGVGPFVIITKLDECVDTLA